MSIRRRILLALSALLIVGSLLSWMAIRMVQDIETSISLLSSSTAIEASTAAKMVVTMTQLENQLGSMVSLRKRFAEGDVSGETVLDSKWRQVMNHYQVLQNDLTNCLMAVELASAAEHTRIRPALRDDVASHWRRIQELRMKLDDFKGHLENFRARLNGSPAEASIYLEGDLNAALEELVEAFNRNWFDNEGMLAVAAIGARAQASRTVAMILLLWCLTALGIVILTWWSVRSFMERLSVIRQAVSSIGQGDLEVRLPSGHKDELGEIAEAFNTMCEDLHRTTLSRDYVETILQNTPLPLIVVSPTGFIRSSNRACGLLLGIGPNELDCHPWALVFPPGQSLSLAPALSREVVLRAQANQLIPVSLSMAAVRDENDQPVDWICVMEDLRDRKRTEEAMRELQASLLESSRKAGMSEIATGVLHNIGNVLNSVNVSANLMLEQLRRSRAASFSKAAELLRLNLDQIGQFITQDPKGQKLPKFLIALADQLNQEHLRWMSELEQLLQNIDHMKQVVAVQQSHAKGGGLVERLSLESLMEDALRLASASFAQHDIEVVRDFESMPEPVVDKHKVLQILINLLRNAKHALLTRASGRRLTLRIRRVENGERLQIQVADNGEGIEPEYHRRIFQHGFTTKKSGHGFGLHSGANSAKEMGGTLSVASHGAGCGAVFTLELPFDGPTSCDEALVRESGRVLPSKSRAA